MWARPARAMRRPARTLSEGAPRGGGRYAPGECRAAPWRPAREREPAGPEARDSALRGAPHARPGAGAVLPALKHPGSDTPPRAAWDPGAPLRGSPGRLPPGRVRSAWASICARGAGAGHPAGPDAHNTRAGPRKRGPNGAAQCADRRARPCFCRARVAAPLLFSRYGGEEIKC